MRIQRLELHGFKSFVEPTSLHLGPGIAAVVGPNGCGKSNVIDAIRWTLGEQSPGTLRGKAMADVIFSGAQGRPPANFAEVSLIFDNSDGSFGGRYRRYGEIAVTRRLDRSGASAYSINRQRCRLKDVVELFVDTGVGARAYSIIEQGRVGFVVSARPEERKLLIDEVAGVNRFKGQRSEAERRMKETRANLVRVADLSGELDRQRTSLSAQARKAERFMELRDKWKETAVRALLIDVAQLLRRRRDLSAEATGAASALDESEAAVVAAETASSEALAAADELRHRVAARRTRRAQLMAAVRAADESAKERGEEAAGLTDRIEGLGAELADLERSDRGSVRLRDASAKAAAEARERFADAKSRQGQVLSEASIAAGRARAASAALEEGKQRQLQCMTAAARERNSLTLLARRLEDIADELAGEARSRTDQERREQDAEERVGVAAAQLLTSQASRGDARSARDAAEHALNRLQTDAQVAQVRATAAEREASAVQALLAAETELVETLAGAQPGIRALVDWLRGPGLTSKAGAGFEGVVADLLTVPVGLEEAAELALDDRVDGAVFSTPQALRAAARWLEVNRPGRAVLILLAGSHSGAGLGGRVTSGASPLAAQLLGSVEIFDSMDDATLTPGAIGVVPPLGAVDGLVVRIGGGSKGSPLARRARVHQLVGRSAGADAERVRSQEAADRARAAVVEARATSRARIEQLHAAELAELGCRRDLDAARADRRAMEEEAAKAVTRRARFEESRSRLSLELERVTVVAAETESRQAALEGELQALHGALRAAEEGSSEATARATTAQLDLAEARHEAATLEREHRRANEELGQREQRRTRIQRELGAARSRASLVAQRTATARESATRSRSELDEVETAHPALESELQAAQELAALTRARLTSFRQSAVQARSRTMRSSNELARLDARLELLTRRGDEEFAIEAEALAAALLDEGQTSVDVATGPDRPVLSIALGRSELDGDPKELGKVAARLARQADEFGAVNMAAAQEFAEVDERWRELTRQRDDLDAALADIRRAIRTIEDETRQRFREAFEAVAQRFAQLYPRLVGGGQAELLLTAPDDLLETGVEIRVEPPGKRLQNLQLLSGGEKAMAAIAFVFAIFEVKPSPFCLLDEVDAPLDESNSRRFNSMLSELATTTQFMVITHNRTTMEVADVLYGVTMQSPGVSSVVSVRVDERGPADRMRGPAGEEHS